MTNDMTKGSPIKLILSFMVPLLIGNIFQQFYNMADTIIVGRTISVEALAAVGATGSISFLIVGFVQGVTSGFAVITAQRFGAGSENGVRRSRCNKHYFRYSRNDCYDGDKRIGGKTAFGDYENSVRHYRRFV